ncbi:hypothetical protein IscW_ISCW002206 [Ixodes scapularis]|uniref:Uncharacterized protein n=1 Tax=Ixodes scapularis TaxID=6945 RepID=B7P9L9_IXOSC|nr:hypothetical protein IscW_ISCW002206 [Ixodes scapularis]|eukprot:XP_002404717.1 hypothetical protein IscW_ISCW002206 [Ixodes scapularis]
MDKPERMSRFASTGEDGSETSESGMRRCSSGLLSPPVDGCSTDQESGGFYLLKKDSQRRQTILRVLEEDADTARPLLPFPRLGHFGQLPRMQITMFI